MRKEAQSTLLLRIEAIRYIIYENLCAQRLCDDLVRFQVVQVDTWCIFSAGKVGEGTDLFALGVSKEYWGRV